MLPSVWTKFSDNCLTIVGKPRKNLNHELDPTGDRNWALCVRSNDVTSQPKGWKIVLWEFPVRRPRYFISDNSFVINMD